MARSLLRTLALGRPRESSQLRLHLRRLTSTWESRQVETAVDSKRQPLRDRQRADRASNVRLEIAKAKAFGATAGPVLVRDLLDRRERMFDTLPA